MTARLPEYLHGTEIEERFHESPVGGLVIGMGWGDEGKGKITDAMVQAADVVIRFQGGHNAGHSVKVGDKEYALHILPSGMVSEGKINLIMSSCVLGLHLNKVDLKKFKITDKGVICNKTLNELLLRDDENQIKEVGLIPELKNLEKGGINTKKSGLKISSEVPLIGMHNVLLDALDEKSREYANLRPIGSTGSGISPAYSSEGKRLHFTLGAMLQNPDMYYSSIKSLWSQVRHIFPQISEDELINKAKEEEKLVRKYIKNGTIELIDDEQEYIEELVDTNKKIIGEGAQSVMISEENSYFGTASTPSLQTFMKATGLTSEQIGNIFGVLKMPPSSVGTRPTFMKFLEDMEDGFKKMFKLAEVTIFKNKYKEYGVSSGRLRDLFYHSLVETARAMYIATYGLDDESKFVPVFNRVDGLEDSFKMYPNEQVKIITGYKYNIKDIMDEQKINQKIVGLDGKPITPNNARKNYPNKSQQLNLFSLDAKKDVEYQNINGNTPEKITQILGYSLASMFESDEEREYIIGTGPDRNDLELRKSKPLRIFN